MIYEKDLKSRCGVKDGVLMVESEISFKSSSSKALDGASEKEVSSEVIDKQLLGLGDVFYMEARRQLSLLEQFVFPMGNTESTKQQIKEQFDKVYAALKIQKGEFSKPENVH